MTTRTTLATGIGMALALVTTGSFAQDTSGGGLEEIIVTAQKHEQNLKEVPESVSVISGGSVRDFLGSAENIRALAGRVPSLNIESSNGRTQPRFYIRGLGNIDFDNNAAQPVSMIFDDIVLENSVLKSVPLFDIEHIEVLKGPQGTLFGRNTTAGIVKIDSVKPSYETDGYVSAGYGERDTWFTEGAVGSKITDGVAGRLAVKYQKRENWIDNTVNGSGDDYGAFDETAVRAQLLFDPTEDFSALIKFHAFNMKGPQPQVFYGNALEVGHKGLRSGFDLEKASLDGGSSFDLEQRGGSANLRWEVGDVTLTSITGYETVDNYQRADIDGGLVGGPEAIGVLGRQAFFNVESGDGLDDHNQLTQEFRLSQQAGKLFYQVGLYYFDESIAVRSNNYDSSTGLQSSEDIAEQDTTSKAAFGQLEYALTDAHTITAGVRYTQDEKQLDAIPGVGSTAFRDSIDADDDYVNWDLAWTWDLNDAWTLYTRAATASRGPVTLGRFGFTSAADTETETSIEGGFKSDLWDGKARWNTTIYAYEIEDMQLTATGGVTNNNRLLNADKVLGSGLETELELLITENLRVSANLSYNKTEIDDPNLKDDLCGSTPTCTSRDPIVGMRMGNFGPVTEVSIDGNPLPRAPEWLGNIVLQYSVPLESGSLYFNTDWNYRSESNLFLHESVEFVAEERWIGGVRAGYKNSDESWDLALVGRNVTDEIVVDGGINFLNLTAFVNEPRFWGVESSYKF